MRRIVVVGLVVLVVVALSSLRGTRGQSVPDATTGLAPKAVVVTNFPAVQAVAGAVNVGNLPAVQNVTGTVAVGNLPLDVNGNLRTSSIVTVAPTVIRFVGFSDQTFTVPQTCCDRMPVLAMHRACAASFPGTRSCDFHEVFRSIPPPPPLPTTSVLIVRQAPDDTSFEGNCVHEDGTLGGCGAGPWPVACCGF